MKRLAVCMAVLTASSVLAIGGLLYNAHPVHANKPNANLCSFGTIGTRIKNPEGTWQCQCEKVSVNDYVCDWVIVNRLAIWANANGLYSLAELGYTGAWYAMLRARSPSVGAWETHWLGPNPTYDGTWFLTNDANGADVSAEFGYSGAEWGMLRARASVVDVWEKYYLFNNGRGLYAFQSYTQPAPCCYVSTEIGYGGDEYAMLRARATAIGPWEQYGFIDYTPLSPAGANAATNSTAITPTGSVWSASTARAVAVKEIRSKNGKRVACPAGLTNCRLLVGVDPTAGSR